MNEATAKSYKAMAHEFFEWCRRRELQLTSAALLDVALVDWQNHFYKLGHRAWRGERLLAAVWCLLPEYGKYGEKSLPRSIRALKGWRRLCPSLSLAGPWAGVHGARLRQSFIAVASS